MDKKKLNRCGKRKRKINSNDQELQDDYFSKTGLQTNNFVKQSKENYKNLDGVRSLQILNKKGCFFQILYMKILRISRVFILIRSN